jgi:hypothetical protein
LYDKVRSETIGKYPAFKKHFSGLESKIKNNPFEARKEIILWNGKHISAYKRNMRTEFFSGMLPGRYTYLNVLYALTSDNKIVTLNASLHDYAD